MSRQRKDVPGTTMLIGLAVLIGVVGLLFIAATRDTALIKTVVFWWLATVLFLVLLGTCLFQGEVLIPRSKMMLPLGLYVCLAVVSALLSRYRYASLQELAALLCSAMLLFVTAKAVRNERALLLTCGVLAAVAALSCLYGFLQHYGLDFLIRGQASWPDEGRSFSTMGHPNFFATFLILALPLFLSLFHWAEKPLVKAGAIVLICALLVCLLYTKSRGAWLGYLGALPVWFFFSLATRRWRWILLAPVVSSVAAMFLLLASQGARGYVILWALPFWLVFVLLLQVGGGERIVRFARRPAWGASLLVAVVLISNLLVDRAGIGGRMEGAFETEKGSVRSRKIIWAGTSKMLVAKPVFGWGIGTFGIYFPRFRDPVTAGKIMPNTIHAHSEYLEVGAEMGVFGLALFLWMLGAFAWDGVRRVRQARDGLQRMAMVGLLAGCIAILLQAAVSVTTRWVVGRFFLWLAMGLTIAAGRMPSPQHPPRKKGEREKAPEQVVEGFYRIRVRPIRSPALRAVCVLFAVGVAGAAAWWGGRVFASAVLTRRAEGYQMAAETLLEQRRDDAALPDALRARELFQERAIELYGRAIELNPYNLSAYYKLGHSYNLQGKFRDALRTYRRMQELSPDGSDIHFNLGVVYANMRRWEESRREYETALRMKIGPLTRLGLARAYENLRLPDKAERQYQALLLDYPDNLRGLNALARFYLRKGENAKAMEFYTKAVAIDPQDADARLGRGLIYQKLGDRYKAQGDNERAAAYYKKSVAEQEIAVTNRPDSVPVRAALALVYAEVGQFDKALAELRTADRIRPRDPLVHLNFGKVYRRKGEPEMAVEEFRRAREIDPGGPWGAEARRELEAMGVE